MSMNEKALKEWNIQERHMKALRDKGLAAAFGVETPVAPPVTPSVATFPEFPEYVHYDWEPVLTKKKLRSFDSQDRWRLDDYNKKYDYSLLPPFNPSSGILGADPKEA